ncbi:hypothetical protein BX616_007961 [Lobosporangium transversale]|uniref:HTH CENPB-type domain-containing protein n=1 Tax=Lobosporangium transversale TaxID=64571 RepID=A0A1Y2G9F9_9FUNG|nr:hypothetical protein BCR41DRAFT_426236 [Lobosporangium transversale]KAF9914592.1 hypothetical protein BX616_007961 [Lobosporangium transversale]ORZ01837.1 hypothetical protein BCR41DRAFT_426236 [Lobosporangium transversale]|eukprot:XP_021876134.1 hypothetical protein BCR41DRAFT_426236 [Lobosporangium transversale]
MGVFGEKHTSLTREQKRQLIHQADTYKLRPTEVCDWVQATWGLRIARVTVYSILHKQRASLMAGHKDLYQNIQSTQNGSSQMTDAHSTNTHSANDSCLSVNKETGRVNKYRASPNKNKNKNKDSSNDSNTKCSRSSSVMSDGSSTASSLDGTGEGARWEGQLKRVREPASVELDRAMVAFLKSPASVDSQGRRLNDAELQSHALRLAQSIPSAKRMRCSFGWLRHFKRRLGVQWAADKLGRYRWIVEMDHQKADEQATSADASMSSSSTIEIKKEHSMDNGRQSSTTGSEDDEEEYHSTYEFGSEASPSPSPMKQPKSTPPTTTQQNQDLVASTTQQNSTQSLLNSYSHLFGTLPPLHVPSSTAPLNTISPLATTLDPKLTSTVSPSTTMPASSAFGMSVDGKMRKVPTKEEAYEMLQSLLMYYEQDHSYIGEQQTLLLPRWIHQQRQIMQQDTEAKMMWMRQQQQQLHQPLAQQQPFSFYQPLLFPFQALNAQQQNMSSEPHHPYHRYHSSFSSTSTAPSTLSSSSPALSPMSPVLPLTPQSPTANPFSFGLSGVTATSVRLSDPFMSAKPDLSSTFAGFEQQMMNDPSLLF